MREQLQARLEDLKREFDAGEARIRELESEVAYVRETVLRISGAIKVLEEVLSASAEETALRIQRDAPDATND